MGDFKKWGDPSNGGVVLKWDWGGGGDTPLWTMQDKYVTDFCCTKF